ncbi:peroxiredoxin-like family protein [Fischerella thermalis]|uniref:thioredoxin-dependent peroxiredoxin n=1 Tax=Fischerella thermalis CCMEE 5318 TaxID=2019666 RepID=A0A2N6LL04_9CYAN|nr:peroxiredoxin-like family protein [Fischerella thermalis]PMB25559.1 alkyl hydroperoxide reductase [Fischerella thermalis CCMEE 5318]
MNLTEDLVNLAVQMESQMPEDVKVLMEQAAIDLLNSGISDNCLKAGDRIPSFILPNAIAQLVDIHELLKSGLVVISFYRGGWCPYCNLELRALQQALPHIKAYGGTLVAISPQTPDNSLSTVEKNELTFAVLSDVGNQVARQFGLVFTIPEALRPIYQGFGINLPASNGDETFELPIPATYVVNTDGVIVHAFVNPDYTQRQNPEEIITILKEMTNL